MRDFRCDYIGLNASCDYFKATQAIGNENSVRQGLAKKTVWVGVCGDCPNRSGKRCHEGITVNSNFPQILSKRSLFDRLTAVRFMERYWVFVQGNRMNVMG